MPSPAWFPAALATAPQERTAAVEGTVIAYRAWGDPADRSIVLVHGGAAHSRWWDHIGPLLANGWRVLALDLSGHGDSGRRDSYSLDTWARQVLPLVTHARTPAPSVVIRHSVGRLGPPPLPPPAPAPVPRAPRRGPPHHAGPAHRARRGAADAAVRLGPLDPARIGPGGRSAQLERRLEDTDFGVDQGGNGRVAAQLVQAAGAARPDAPH